MIAFLISKSSLYSVTFLLYSTRFLFHEYNIFSFLPGDINDSFSKSSSPSRLCFLPVPVFLVCFIPIFHVTGVPQTSAQTGWLLRLEGWVR